MNKLDMMKEKLLEIAKTECPDQVNDVQELFRREIEIPISGTYDLDQDPSWFDINDYID